MRLANAYTEPQAADVLYRLMFERPQASFISHQRLPTFAQHEEFVNSRPFRYWYVISAFIPYQDYGASKSFVGAIECTDRNEVGISIFHVYQRQGLASQALKLFFDTHEPLPALPAIRNGSWLANISLHNEESKAFFRCMGFSPLQETWKRL